MTVTLLTPFGAPFDTAVLAGLAFVVLTFVLAGRGHDRRHNQERRDRT